MKARLAVITALVVMANEASAQRVHGRMQVRHMSHTPFYSQVPRPVIRDRSNMYESDSISHQWFANPDRLLPVPSHE